MSDKPAPKRLLAEVVPMPPMELETYDQILEFVLNHRRRHPPVSSDEECGCGEFQGGWVLGLHRVTWAEHFDTMLSQELAERTRSHWAGLSWADAIEGLEKALDTRDAILDDIERGVPSREAWHRQYPPDWEDA